MLGRKERTIIDRLAYRNPAFPGEMRKLRGYIGTRGTVAYMPQQPWIQNATVRDNILMGMDFDSGKYNEIVEVGQRQAI